MATPHALTMDLGGTRLKMGLVTGGDILAMEILEWDSAAPFTQNIKEVEVYTRRLLRSYNLKPSDLLGIGMALPGIIDPYEKRILSLNDKHTEAQEFDFSAWAKNLGFRSLVLENDARAALVGEVHQGAAKQADPAVMVTFGTGIGVACTFGGKLMYGKNFQLGSLSGHSVVDFQGPSCNCGGIGCAEGLASGWKLPELIYAHPHFSATAWPSKTQNFKSLLERYHSGIPLAIDLVDYCLKVWGACLTNLVYAYDPACIVMGGGIMQAHEFWIPRLQEQVKMYAWKGAALPPLKPALLGNSAALLGLYHLLQSV